MEEQSVKVKPVCECHDGIKRGVFDRKSINYQHSVHALSETSYVKSNLNCTQIKRQNTDTTQNRTVKNTNMQEKPLITPQSEIGEITHNNTATTPYNNCVQSKQRTHRKKTHSRRYKMKIRITYRRLLPHSDLAITGKYLKVTKTMRTAAFTRTVCYRRQTLTRHFEERSVARQRRQQTRGREPGWNVGQVTTTASPWCVSLRVYLSRAHVSLWNF